MERRKFIKQSALGLSSLYSASSVFSTDCSTGKNKESDLTVPISQVDKPLAIAMWDFSWILRHHRYGEFEDWDRVIGELADRGYNAIRMDTMPQFVTSTKDGEIIEEFRNVREGWAPVLWGSDYTMSFRPREALLEFLPLCKKHGVKVGLATWFLRHGTSRQDIFMEEGGLLRAWTETLEFLQAHDLLDNVIYVDLLNEYPAVHGYDWLKNELNKRRDRDKFKLNNPQAYVAELDAAPGNNLERAFANNFITATIRELKKKFPDLEFFASYDRYTLEEDDCHLTEFAALDFHIWFGHQPKYLPGLNEIIDDPMRPQNNLAEVQKQILEGFRKNRAPLLDFVEGRIHRASEIAARHKIPCGNTEGWGPIQWFDHPELDWNFVKESAEICVDMALKHENYKFICTSNFTHPQFRGLWEDVAWHRQMTDRIKS